MSWNIDYSPTSFRKELAKMKADGVSFDKSEPAAPTVFLNEPGEYEVWLHGYEERMSKAGNPYTCAIYSTKEKPESDKDLRTIMVNHVNKDGALNSFTVFSFIKTFTGESVPLKAIALKGVNFAGFLFDNLFRGRAKVRVSYDGPRAKYVSKNAYMVVDAKGNEMSDICFETTEQANEWAMLPVEPCGGGGLPKGLQRNPKITIVGPSDGESPSEVVLDILAAFKEIGEAENVTQMQPVAAEPPPAAAPAIKKPSWVKS
jgi:hypothetical protein